MSDETTSEQLAEIEEQAAEYTPPDGWRVLQVGEKLQPGDMWVMDSPNRWRPTVHVGAFVRSNQRYIRRIEPEPQPQPQAATIEEPRSEAVEVNKKRLQQVVDLRNELNHVERLWGESRQRVTELEELVTSLRTINEGTEKAVRLANQQNTDLEHRLKVVSAEWAEQVETSRRLQIELDAAQQVPQAVSDRFEEGWDAGTARAVETIAEWLQAFRGCNSPSLALLLLEALPAIMRSLTGLTPED